MWKFLKNLLKSDKQFRLENLEIVNRIEIECEQMLVLAATIVDVEEKNKVIKSIHKIQKDNTDFKNTLLK